MTFRIVKVRQAVTIIINIIVTGFPSRLIITDTTTPVPFRLTGMGAQNAFIIGIMWRARNCPCRTNPWLPRSAGHCRIRGTIRTIRVLPIHEAVAVVIDVIVADFVGAKGIRYALAPEAVSLAGHGAGGTEAR